MQFMGAELRRISLKDGVVAALLSLALTGGMAMAFHTTGRDPWQALDATVPVFIGTLATSAGINMFKSPLLMALIAVGAGVVMYGARLALGIPVTA